MVLGIAVGFGFVAFSFTGLVADAWDVLIDMDLTWIAAALGCVVVAYCFRSLHMRVVSGTRRAAPVRTALGFRVLGTVLPALAGTLALAGLRIGQPAANAPA